MRDTLPKFLVVAVLLFIVGCTASLQIPSGMISSSVGASYLFADSFLTFTSDREITLSSSGIHDIDALTPIGVPTAPFSYKGGSFPGTGGTCRNRILHNTSCTIVISFAPTSVGNFQSTLAVSYNDGATQRTLSVSVAGRAVALSHWSFAPDSGCEVIGCNTAGVPNSGTFTANEIYSGAAISGTYTRPASGFIKLNIPPGASAGTAAWNQSLPFSVFAIEAPGMMITAPLLTLETGPNIFIEGGSCGVPSFNANLVGAHWGTNDDAASAAQAMSGQMSWGPPATSITSFLNVSNFASILSAPLPVSVGTCAAGNYSSTESTGINGTISVAGNQILHYQRQDLHAYLAVPAAPIPNSASLWGKYAGVRFDTYDGTVYPMAVSVNQNGSALTATKLSNAFTGAVDTVTPLTETFSFSVNSPGSGFISGTNTGINSAKLTCAFARGLQNSINTKNAIVCSGQSPSDPNHHAPFNLHLVSVGDYPGGIDYTFFNTGENNVGGSINSGCDESGFSALVIQTDGKIVAGGRKTRASTTHKLVGRFMPDGTLDPTFNAGGASPGIATGLFPGLYTIPTAGGNFDSVLGMVLETGGNIIVGGESNGRFSLTRLDSTGAVDATYGTGGTVNATLDFGGIIATLLMQPDAKVVAAGQAYDGAGKPHFGIARFTTAGALDTPGFGNAGSGYTVAPFFTYPGGYTSTGDGLLTAARQSDGKVLGAGYSIMPGLGVSPVVARFTADGSQLDATFNSAQTPGYLVLPAYPTTSNSSTEGLAVQPDGKILFAYSGQVSNGEIFVTRITMAGVIDTTFNPSGTDALGNIIGAGSVAFTCGPAATHPLNHPKMVKVLPDGKILVGGNTQDSGNNTTTTCLIRLNADGTLDSTYGTNGIREVPSTPGVNNAIFEAFALQADGNVAVAGYSDDVNYGNPMLYGHSAYCGDNAAVWRVWK